MKLWKDVCFKKLNMYGNHDYYLVVHPLILSKRKFFQKTFIGFWYFFPLNSTCACTYTHLVDEGLFFKKLKLSLKPKEFDI